MFGIALIAYRPAGFREQPVNIFSGFVFWGGHFRGHQAEQMGLHLRCNKREGFYAI